MKCRPQKRLFQPMPISQSCGNIISICSIAKRRVNIAVYSWLFRRRNHFFFFVGYSFRVFIRYVSSITLFFDIVISLWDQAYLKTFALRKEIKDKLKKIFNACYKKSPCVNSPSITFCFLLPIDCFRDGSGLNALKIKNCLTPRLRRSFFNLAGRSETDCKETITGRLSFGSVFLAAQENEQQV